MAGEPPPASAGDGATSADGAGSSSTGGRASNGRKPAGRNLPLAIASGVLLAGILLGSLAWDPIAVLVLVAAVIVVAMLELDIAFRSTGVRPATPVAAGAGLVMLFGAYAGGSAALLLGLILLVFGAVLWTVLGTRPEQVLATVGATLLIGLWVPFLASHLALLIARDHGEWIVLAVIALTVSNDIGAYGFGWAFGRHKLAPRISPAKSWEGAAGGLATVLVLAALITAQLPGFDLPTALLLGAAVVPAAIAGDLAESLVKRDLGVKDLGRILPGHGGMMDRVDSIVFTLPAAHLLLVALGV